MKKRSIKKYKAGGLTNLQQNVQGTNPNAEMLGETAGTAVGYGAGMALNTVAPGLGFIAAPILGKLGGMGGKAVGDMLDTSDDVAEAKRKQLEASYDQYNQANQTYSLQNNRNRGLSFAEGGMVLDQDHPNPTEELELNEQFQMPDGQMGEVNGPSHEMGGVQTNLPEGTRVFSDKLKHGGKTFAKIVKPINNRLSKLDNNPHVSESIKDNTKMLLNKQLDHYFEIQETNKQNDEMKRSLKYKNGGIIKYDDGGIKRKTIKNPYTINPMEADEIPVEYDVNNPMLRFGPRPTSPVLPIETSQPVPPQYGNWGFNGTQEGQDKQFAQTSPVTPIDPYQKTQTTTTLQDPTGSASTSPVTSGGGFGSFLEGNAGQIGQIATAGITTALQARNLNKLARPKTLAKIKLADKIANPNLVDYSAQRSDIDRAALSQMDQASRGLSNSATTQAFRNQANINRLTGTGKSRQEESNTNAEIKNRFLAQRNQASMHEETANNDIDKYNLENQYNYDTFKTGQKGQIIGTLGETAGQVFGNQTKYQNQLDQANIMANSREQTVNRDLLKGNRSLADNALKTGKITQAQYDAIKDTFTKGGIIKKRTLAKK